MSCRWVCVIHRHKPTSNMFFIRGVGAKDFRTQGVVASCHSHHHLNLRSLFITAYKSDFHAYATWTQQQ